MSIINTGLDDTLGYLGKSAMCANVEAALLDVYVPPVDKRKMVLDEGIKYLEMVKRGMQRMRDSDFNTWKIEDSASMEAFSEFYTIVHGYPGQSFAYKLEQFLDTTKQIVKIGVYIDVLKTPDENTAEKKNARELFSKLSAGYQAMAHERIKQPHTKFNL